MQNSFLFLSDFLLIYKIIIEIYSMFFFIFLGRWFRMVSKLNIKFSSNCCNFKQKITKILFNHYDVLVYENIFSNR